MIDARSRSPRLHPQTLPIDRLKLCVLEKSAPSWFVPPSAVLHLLNLLFKSKSGAVQLSYQPCV